MYQKRILPYFIIPSTFSPQASSPLERYGQKHHSPGLISGFSGEKKSLRTKISTTTSQPFN
jgi:hypothetical protein